jgi:hypothetical protein
MNTGIYQPPEAAHVDVLSGQLFHLKKQYFFYIFTENYSFILVFMSPEAIL